MPRRCFVSTPNGVCFQFMHLFQRMNIMIFPRQIIHLKWWKLIYFFGFLRNFSTNFLNFPKKYRKINCINERNKWTMASETTSRLAVQKYGTVVLCVPAELPMMRIKRYLIIEGTDAEGFSNGSHEHTKSAKVMDHSTAIIINHSSPTPLKDGNKFNQMIN